MLWKKEGDNFYKIHAFTMTYFWTAIQILTDIKSDNLTSEKLNRT